MNVLLAIVTENKELLAAGTAVGVNLAFWLRLEHRLTKLETIVRLLVKNAKNADE